MKTTVELSDALADEARAVARRDGTTLRELIETGLRRVLDDRTAAGDFKLRDASFGGRGLTEEFRGAGWERMAEATYDRRGA